MPVTEEVVVYGSREQDSGGSSGGGAYYGGEGGEGRSGGGAPDGGSGGWQQNTDDPDKAKTEAEQKKKENAEKAVDEAIKEYQEAVAEGKIDPDKPETDPGFFQKVIDAILIGLRGGVYDPRSSTIWDILWKHGAPRALADRVTQEILDNEDVVEVEDDGYGESKSDVADRWEVYRQNGGKLSLEDWIEAGQPEVLGNDEGGETDTRTEEEKEQERRWQIYIGNGGKKSYDDWLRTGEPVRDQRTNAGSDAQLPDQEQEPADPGAQARAEAEAQAANQKRWQDYDKYKKAGGNKTFKEWNQAGQPVNDTGAGTGTGTGTGTGAGDDAGTAGGGAGGTDVDTTDGTNTDTGTGGSDPTGEASGDSTGGDGGAGGGVTETKTVYGDNTRQVRVTDADGNVLYEGPVNEMPQEVHDQMDPNTDWEELGGAPDYSNPTTVEVGGTQTDGTETGGSDGTGGATAEGTEGEAGAEGEDEGGGLPAWLTGLFPFLLDLGLDWLAADNAADAAKDAAEALAKQQEENRRLMLTTLYGDPDAAPGGPKAEYPGVYPSLKPFMDAERNAVDMYQYQLGLGPDPRPEGGPANPYYDLPFVQDMEGRMLDTLEQRAANAGVSKSAPTFRDITKASGDLYYRTYGDYMGHLQSLANPVTTTNFGNLALGQQANLNREATQTVQYGNDARIAGAAAENAFYGSAGAGIQNYWQSLRI